MNARNLAVCFAPSLFDAWKTKASADGRGRGTRRRRRRRVDDSVLTPKEQDDQRGAHECLAAMIASAKDLFTVRPEPHLQPKLAEIFETLVL